jgi:CHAD domain-containing protein
MSSAANRRSIGIKLGDFVLEQLTQAQGLLVCRGEKRQQGVHEARKCMRRARSAIAMLDGKRLKAASRLDKSLAKLCRSLSSLRDAQALNEALSRLGQAKSIGEMTSPSADAAMLSRALVAADAIRKQALKQALLQDPEFAERRARLQSAGADSAALPWLELTAQDLTAALQYSDQRAEKAARRAAKDTKDDERWHSFRKRVRRLRQQRGILEKIAPRLLPKQLSGKKHANAKAQELGESQDDALLLQFCKQPSHFKKDVRIWLREVAKARLKQVRQAPQ